MLNFDDLTAAKTQPATGEFVSNLAKKIDILVEDSMLRKFINLPVID